MWYNLLSQTGDSFYPTHYLNFNCKTNHLEIINNTIYQSISVHTTHLSYIIVFACQLITLCSCLCNIYFLLILFLHSKSGRTSKNCFSIFRHMLIYNHRYNIFVIECVSLQFHFTTSKMELDTLCIRITSYQRA